MTKGETKTGFKFEIDERVATDIFTVRLLTSITRKTKENPEDMTILDDIEDLGEKLLGDKGYDKLISHIQKKNDGFCNTEVLSEEIIDVYLSIKSKN